MATTKSARITGRDAASPLPNAEYERLISMRLAGVGTLR
jgi:hypothetical protein